GEMGPFRLKQVVWIGVVSNVGRFGRDERTATQAKVRMLNVVREIDLVLGRHLIGEANPTGHVVLSLGRWPAQIGRVDRRVLSEVVITARHQVLVTKGPKGGEKPELVLLEWASNGRTAVIGAVRRINRMESASLQSGCQVVADQAVA